MKLNLFKGILIFFLITFGMLTFSSYVQAKDYEYKDLNITADILNDGTINIKENFTANFFVNKHGIIRDIPLNYSVGGEKFHIEISDINVLGENFTTSKSDGERHIKIGDADRTVIGEHVYPISYFTYGLIRNFSGMGYSELYWNLVGNGFDTNINNVRAEIILPKPYTGLTSDDFLITTDGNSKTISGFDGTVDWSSGDKIIITYNKGLQAYHGITLAIKFPNNYFKFDHNRQERLLGYIKNSGGDFSSNHWLGTLGYFGIIGLFMFIFAGILTFVGKAYKKIGKIVDIKSGSLKGDFAAQFPVIVQYKPPQGINSAEAGLLLHRGSRVKDMLSLIYKWASQGLITLSTEKTECSSFKKSTNYVIITKNMDIPEESPTYEKNTFNSLVRNEKNKIGSSSNLYNKLSLSSLERYGIDNGWFNENQKSKFIRLFLPVGICILITIFIERYPLLSLFALFALGFLESIPKGSKLEETEEGAELISHILGYRKFLKECDENKLKSFLKEDPLYFDKILPYAVVFGLDTELIKKIEPIMQEMNIKSSWYNGDLHSMSMINNIISNSATYSVASSSSSSSYSSSGGFSSGSSFSGGGGGFSSGGGGGGGGGSSW